MKAQLKELKGKYYGTIIELTDQNGFKFEIKLWNNGNGEPSDRELAGRCTIEEWRDNKTIEVIEENNGIKEFYYIEAKQLVEICDSHFESRETYSAAIEIIVGLELTYRLINLDSLKQLLTQN